MIQQNNRCIKISERALRKKSKRVAMTKMVGIIMAIDITGCLVNHIRDNNIWYSTDTWQSKCQSGRLTIYIWPGPWVLFKYSISGPRWRLKTPSSRLFTQPFVQAQIEENIKALRHRWPMNSPHKGSVTRKMFPFDDVINTNFMESRFAHNSLLSCQVILKFCTEHGSITV